MPALATTTSMPPNFWTACSAAEFIAARLHTSATTVRTCSSPPSSPEIVASAAASRSVSTSLAPLACNRRATSAPIPWPPPVMNTTCESTDVMAATYLLLPPWRQFHSKQRIRCSGDRARRLSVVATVFQRIGSPTIQCGKRFGCIEIVGEILAQPRDQVGGVRPGGQSGGGSPPLQPRVGVVQHLRPPVAVGPIVPGQQAQSDGGGIHTLGTQT